MKTPLLLLLRAYKLGVSPFLGQHCRFYPSCSDYAAEAIRRHGAWQGSLLAGKRLCKCHPWHAGGLDPVPELAAVEVAGLVSAVSRLDSPSDSTADSSSVSLSPTVAAGGCSHS